MRDLSIRGETIRLKMSAKMETQLMIAPKIKPTSNLVTVKISLFQL